MNQSVNSRQPIGTVKPERSLEQFQNLKRQVNHEFADERWLKQSETPCLINYINVAFFYNLPKQNLIIFLHREPWAIIALANNSPKTECMGMNVMTVNGNRKYLQLFATLNAWMCKKHSLRMIFLQRNWFIIDLPIWPLMLSRKPIKKL